MKRPMPDDALDLDAIEARCEAATPGPWKMDQGVDWECYGTRFGDDDETDECPCQGSHNYRDCREPSIIHGAWIEGPKWIEAGDADGLYFNEDDAEFCAAARTDVPALVAALRRERERVAELVAAYDNWMDTALDPCDDDNPTTLRWFAALDAARATLGPKGEGE